MWGQIFNYENPLIHADNTWVLMAITFGWVAFSIYAEQTWKWAEKMTGAIIALIGALILTNMAIIPTRAPFFDEIIWDYVVPIAIPLLLLQCDVKKIGSQSGKILIIFFIGAIGTTVGAIVGAKLLGKYIPHMEGIAGMITGSYIGGGVNFAALASAFKIPGEMIAATTVADNLLMTVYFFILISIPGITFFKKRFSHPYMDEIVEKKESLPGQDKDKTLAASYWEGKKISLLDIAIVMAISVIIVALSKIIAGWLAAVIPTDNVITALLNALFGNQYLIITTLGMLLATFAAPKIERLSAAQEIGTWLIYLFFFAIGVPASIIQIIYHAPVILIFCAMVIFINMFFCFVFGKLFKFNLEEIILASNANIGGPTTATALAISKGWVQLVGPIMLVGTLGYVIGTYFGIFVGNIL